MSDKRKLSTILGVCGATILAAGGTIFLTDTGLSLLERDRQISQPVETGLSEKETELPLTVEQFTPTDNFFEIALNDAAEKETEAETETGTEEKGENPSGNETDIGATGNEQPDSEGADYRVEPDSEADTGDNTGTDAGSEGTSGTVEPELPVPEGPVMYTSGNANIRDLAGGDESQVIGTVPQGEKVSVTGNVVGNWVEVSYAGQTGYIYDELLYDNGGTSGSGTSGASAGGSASGGSAGNGASGGTSYYVEPMSGTMYATGGVNVRTTADTSGEIIGTLSRGESVAVTGSVENGWVQLSYGGQTGYASGNYLSWDKPSGSGDAWDDSYLMYDIDSRYISADELSGWSASDLGYLRNEIFARHGRIFTKSKYSNYFSQKSWYDPTYDPAYFDENLDSFLNDYEWANLSVIQKLEDQLS